MLEQDTLTCWINSATAIAHSDQTLGWGWGGGWAVTGVILVRVVIVLTFDSQSGINSATAIAHSDQTLGGGGGGGGVGGGLGGNWGNFGTGVSYTHLYT